MKIGLFYYSRSGNTKKAAEQLAEKLKDQNQTVELIEILHEKKLGFFRAGRVAMKEEHPPIKNAHMDAITFDRLIIGTPIWAGKPAPYPFTFLDHIKEIDEKKAGVFLTCGGAITKQIKPIEIFKERLSEYNLNLISSSLVFQMNKGLIKDGSQKIDAFIHELLEDETDKKESYFD